MTKGISLENNEVHWGGDEEKKEGVSVYAVPDALADGRGAKLFDRHHLDIAVSALIEITVALVVEVMLPPPISHRRVSENAHQISDDDVLPFLRHERIMGGVMADHEEPHIADGRD